jgi:tRNA(adenine34) deaminase
MTNNNPLPWSVDSLTWLMREALVLAERAGEAGDIPVGAVVFAGAAVVGRGWNQREQLRDPTAHAEILALRDAARTLGSWRLEECVLVVTLEPCVMCAGALAQARIGALAFGAADPKGGACHSLYTLPADGRLNHTYPVVGGILTDESQRLLSRFFHDIRRRTQ